MAPDKQLAGFVGHALDLLVEDGLIEEDEDQQIRPTELGEIMSKFCVRHKTFLSLLHVKPNATLRDILAVVGGAEEYSSLRLRAGNAIRFPKLGNFLRIHFLISPVLAPGESMAYKALNSHPELKCPISGKVTHTWQKVSLK